MIIFQPGYRRTWTWVMGLALDLGNKYHTNHMSVRHYVASLVTDNVNLLLKCYSRRLTTSSIFTWINILSLVSTHHISSWINIIALFELTLGISYLDSAQSAARPMSLCQAKRPAASPLSTLHSWHFYVSDYILLMWFMETFQQQIICIKAQIVMACVSNEQAGLTSTYHCTGNTGMFKLNENKMFVLGDPEWNGLVMTRPVSECSILNPHTPRHLDN